MLVLFLCSCNEDAGGKVHREQERKLPKSLENNFDCVIDQNKQTKITNVLSEADEFVTDVASKDINVTDEDQSKFGDKFLKQIKTEEQYVINNTNKIEIANLAIILSELLRKRPSPSKIKYEIFLLDDDAINAYTVGGKIFVTTAMLKAVTNKDQLYAIVGHEIGHNEKGHIKSIMKQLKVGESIFGEASEKVFQLKSLLTGSFNQKKEVEADYYGLSLMYQLGYDPCSVKDFWDNMATSEQKDNIQDFFGTHPYSDVRSKCVTNHLASNYNLFCQ